MNQPPALLQPSTPFSQQIEHEFIQGSAVAPSLYHAATRIVSDTEVLPGGEVAYPIHETLNWNLTRFGFRARASLRAVLFQNEDGSTWQAKLSKSPEAGRKPYFTPTGNGSRAYLPTINRETRRAIADRYGVEVPPPHDSFWEWLEQHPEIPIIITEGGKKALCLLSQGYVAIALYGVNGGYRATDALGNAIPPTLIPDLARFAVPGRSITLAFDQDTKWETRLKVSRALHKFGGCLAAAGCEVMVAQWKPEQGKGIDDLCVQSGVEAVHQALTNALTLAVYGQRSQVQKSLDVIGLNRLSYPVERATEGEYLPALPSLQPGAIHVLNASMNAGKTTRIGQDWVKVAIAQGWNVLVLAPLNSLGEQTAQDWGLPHIHTYGTTADQQQALWADVSHSHGVVMCPDSLHRLPPWFFDRPLLLALEEANQVVNHLAQGDTLKSRQADILERFTSAARHAIDTGAIVLSEDGLPDRAVKFVQAVSGGAVVRAFTHQKQGKPWECKLYRGQASGYRNEFLKSLEPGQPKLFVTSSQAEAERMQRAIARRHPDLKVERIDSLTNQNGKYSQFFTHPDQWLQANRPDVLIFSPSVKSGLSIEGGISAETAYFEEVWGYFSILDTDTHAQLLGRYRPPVPRIVFCPDFVLTSGDESLLYPRAIKRRLHSNARALAGVYGLEEMLEAGEDRAELLTTIETATLDYLTEATAVVGAQKQIAHQALVNRLERAGHCVVSEKIGKNSSTVTLWKAIQEEIWREDAGTIASGTISPEVHTQKWARQALESLEASLDDRTLARKVLWREEFPGVSFNDAEEVYQALVKDYGAMQRGVTLQAKAENLDAAREDDRAAVEAILKGNIRALHRLPKGYVRARLIAQTGILNLLEETYSNTDPRAIAVKEAALKFAREISYWLRLHVKETQTPVEIVNKLLRKVGLEAIAVSRPGARGQQTDRLYQVSGQDNPIRVRLLEALRRKLSESVSTIRNEKDESIQIVDTASQKPPNHKGWDSPESLADIAGMWRSATTEEMRADLRQWIPPAILRRAVAS